MKLLEVLLLPAFLVTVKGEGTLDQVVFVGGDGFKDVKIFGMLDKQPGGNCSLIPDLHFEPLHSIGLRDHMGRAMVCGGSKIPSPKSCWVLDRASNTWIPLPSLKHERIGAAAVCDDDAGKCWIFGGRSAGGIDNGYVENVSLGSTSANYPYPMFGAVGIQVEARRTFIVAGGVTPSGQGITDVYGLDAGSSSWELQHGFYIDPPRAHPVTVLVAAEDCPCE